MNPHSELSCDDGVQDLTAQFLSSPLAEQTPVATAGTKRDPSIFVKSLEVGRDAKKVLNERLAQMIAMDPHKYAGLHLRLSLESRPKSKPGASKVLLALIDLVLTPSGAAMTQTDCRNKVHASYPEHAMFKDWTKPLPQWACAHADKLIATMNPAIAGIKVYSKTSLRDIHNGAKAAFAQARGEGQVFKAKITVHPDCVLINDTRIMLSINNSNGKAYTTLRISRAALLTALQ